MNTRNRTLSTLVVILCALGLAMPLTACRTKPSKEDCEKAIDNMRKIRGTENTKTGANRGRAVRSCQGNSSRTTVKCFIAAKTVEELVECEGETGQKYLEEETKVRDDIEKKGADRDKDGDDDNKDGE